VLLQKPVMSRSAATANTVSSLPLGVDKARILPNERTEVISVPVGETFTFDVNYAGITLKYGGQEVTKPYPVGLTGNVWTAARVSGWFGGNRVAPRTVSYFIRLN